MKARIIKENSYRKITDYASVGDKIVLIDYACDKNEKYIGYLISTGYVTRNGVNIIYNTVIPASNLIDEMVLTLLLRILEYFKYIFCSNEKLAEFVSIIKDKLSSEGIKSGEIFTCHTETP